MLFDTLKITGFSELINRIKLPEYGIRLVVMKPFVDSEIAMAVREESDGKAEGKLNNIAYSVAIRQISFHLIEWQYLIIPSIQP